MNLRFDFFSKEKPKQRGRAAGWWVP